MEIRPFRIALLEPPKDDLLSKIKDSALTLEEGDVVAVSSKVVSIWQGRCVLKSEASKDELTRREAEMYLERGNPPAGGPANAVMHTITNGLLIPSAGIDPFGDYFVLWPEKPQETAAELLAWFKKTYERKSLYLIITDSRSLPLRQGVTGFAVAWAGFAPLHDGRNRKDLLGNTSGGSQVNLPDSIAAAAVLAMGEANEQTPLVRLRDVPYLNVLNPGLGPKEPFQIPMEQDLFAPFLKNQEWKEGEQKEISSSGAD
jgi:F420-0:gamma-glutamyl ligase